MNLTSTNHSSIAKRAATRTSVANYFDNPFIVEVIFQATMSNTCWFQLLRCEDLLIFFQMYGQQMRNLGFGLNRRQTEKAT